MKFYASPYVMPIGIIVFTILYPPSDQPRPTEDVDVIHTDFPIYADYTDGSQEVTFTALESSGRPIVRDTAALHRELMTDNSRLELSLRGSSVLEMAVLADY